MSNQSITSSRHGGTWTSSCVVDVSQTSSCVLDIRRPIFSPKRAPSPSFHLRRISTHGSSGSFFSDRRAPVELSIFSCSECPNRADVEYTASKHGVHHRRIPRYCFLLEKTTIPPPVLWLSTCGVFRSPSIRETPASHISVAPPVLPPCYPPPWTLAIANAEFITITQKLSF